MKTRTHTAIQILLGIKLLVPRGVGFSHAYQSILVPRRLDSGWGRYPESHFYWLFSGKISNYRIRVCIYLFTLSIIEEHNLIISLINNLIVLCERNQIAIGGQNIFWGNMILCLRCKFVHLPFLFSWWPPLQPFA
jgi:hypothetical protein